MEVLDELRRRARAAYDVLAAEESRVKDERHAALVGKCFVGRNSCSSPSGPQDYWPLYGKVLAAEDGGLIMFEFERDKYGKYQIENGVRRGSLFSSFTPITAAKFNKAWSKFLTEMQAAGEAAKNA